jgi:hypothetical protein
LSAGDRIAVETGSTRKAAEDLSRFRNIVDREDEAPADPARMNPHLIIEALPGTSITILSRRLQRIAMLLKFPRPPDVVDFGVGIAVALDINERGCSIELALQIADPVVQRVFRKDLASRMNAGLGRKIDCRCLHCSVPPHGDNTERADAFRSGGLGLTSRKYSDAELEELKDRNPLRQDRRTMGIVASARQEIHRSMPDPFVGSSPRATASARSSRIKLGIARDTAERCPDLDPADVLTRRAVDGREEIAGALRALVAAVVVHPAGRDEPRGEVTGPLAQLTGRRNFSRSRTSRHRERW